MHSNTNLQQVMSTKDSNPYLGESNTEWNEKTIQQLNKENEWLKSLISGVSKTPNAVVRKKRNLPDAEVNHKQRRAHSGY